MTIEELNSVLTLKTQLELERAKLEDLKICAATVVPSKLSDLPHAKTKTSPTENFAVKIVEAENQIAQLEIELDEARASLALKLQSELRDSPSLWRSVLVRRYCACMTFKDIGTSLHFTTDYIHYLHRQAATFVTGGQWRPRRGQRALSA